ncbi:hypothetical protein [Burkholderia catarinensis]|uniref:hypothetical protein n=1 Tax=Burkholderia catarinensis TaxID=1108140 RepID=UPI000B1990EA|nr:hypothetical protein [Burkholderia catarinensis]
MDTKSVELETILAALHAKFAGNQAEAIAYTREMRPADALPALFFHVSEFLYGKKDSAVHEKLLAQYLKEVFADGVCATYLAFSGLDTPARVLLRRMLELGYVVLAYYDNPAKFWDWNSNDKDISFSELESTLGSEGYITFLSHASKIDVTNYRKTILSLRSAYSELSNVVHPKPYNFETTVDDAFRFSAPHLQNVLSLQDTIHKGLLVLIFCRFPLALEHAEKIDPKIKDRLQS